jgi:Asp-tRNA(Asn)/Glu-tRNA(Gln) amidotransferase A subunit family amidase
LDAEFRNTTVLRTLHGIPIIVKDNINTVGLPTTAGSFALEDFIPIENAFIIDKFVEAGAIVLAKSNMSEWAFSPMHSESATHGTTHNPYNLDYVPAGSSGGSAAAIAANMGLGGLGTDTGNSIRGPSAHNALVGFRTTLGLISREGIVPLYLRNDVVGPMCRNVEDATRMLEVMAGYDVKDPITKNSIDKTPGNYRQFLVKDGLNGARIGILRELTNNNIDPDVSLLFEQAIADLDSLGAEIIDPIGIPNFSTLRQNQWCWMFRKDLESFLATYVKRDTVQTLEDIIRIGTTSEFSKERLKRNASANESEGECLDAYHDAKRIAFREAIESVMDSLDLDGIVYPSWNYKPAHIALFQEEYKGDNSQVIAPHTGQPAFTVPMGFSPGNLPAGIQFLGRMYDEPTLIKLAYSYEQGTKHRKPPIIK